MTAQDHETHEAHEAHERGEPEDILKTEDAAFLEKLLLRIRARALLLAELPDEGWLPPDYGCTCPFRDSCSQG